MKVIMVIPNLDLAGAEIMCTSLSIELKQRGIDILVVSMFNKKTSLSSVLEQNGIKVICLNKHLGIDPKMIFELKMIFDKEKPDVVHTHLDCIKYSAIAAWLSKVPHSIHTVHNIAEKEARGIAQKLNYFIFRYLHVVPVALSREIQESIKNTYKIEISNIPIIFNGIDLSRCNIKQSYTSNNMIFVHVGRFVEQKNHKMLIDAFATYSRTNVNCTLWLIGEGELYDSVLDEVKKLNLTDKVVFWGKRKNVLDIICDADVFVLPSLYEGVPISLVEAMGTGLPTIATSVGGVSSMVDKDSGILIGCNTKELVEAMQKMENEEIRRQMGKSALKTATRKFSSKIMADKYIDLYRS